MIEATLSVIETLLKADGISAKTVDTVRAVILNDGMVSMSHARRVLNLDPQTIKRMCQRHGIRRESRFGRKGSIVDLPALLALERKA